MIVQEHVDLSEVLWYKIGGHAKYLIECKILEDISQAFRFIQENNIHNIFVCGMGSNLIFTDHDFDGAVIRIVKNDQLDGVYFDGDGNVEAFAGELLDRVITFGFEHSLIGLEWAGGLPGTVGAGVRGNVGAYGGEIKDSLVSVDVLDFSNGKPVFHSFKKDQLDFVYRGSLIKNYKRMLVVSAKFDLKRASEAELEAAHDVYKLHIQQRENNHPLEYPNCGSVFKNLRDPQQIEKVLSVFPELKENVEKKWHGKIAVASVIEKLGLKGYRIGDAQVSEKHALFIVNLGHAKAKDVLTIIDTIQNKFQETFGFKLETEVEIVK